MSEIEFQTLAVRRSARLCLLWGPGGVGGGHPCRLLQLPLTPLATSTFGRAEIGTGDRHRGRHPSAVRPAVPNPGFATPNGVAWKYIEVAVRG